MDSFTINFHHGGKFILHGATWSYVGGSIGYLDVYSLDTFSFLQLERDVKVVYAGIRRITYLKPGMGFSEKKHPKLIIENVLVEVEDFKFPIDYLTFGMEEDRQVSFVEIPSIAISQMWINAENGEMTLLVGEKKMISTSTKANH